MRPSKLAINNLRERLAKLGNIVVVLGSIPRFGLDFIECDHA